MAVAFKVSARALRHLGAELITSDDIALYELIKNSFDAKSENVTIKISYPFSRSEERLKQLCKSWSNKSFIARLSSYINSDINHELKEKIVNEF
ncbi:hypothetical protein ACFVYJ_10985 [Pontibacter sp. JAM-7]|uniref:hypothetical protein n=1 Tax=Pontibacter sp. JAM-7 TaxID=3366581 RepID=UPI003AF525B2